MSENARASDGDGMDPKKTWLAVAGAIAAGMAGIVTLSGSPADAQPLPPPPPPPATVTQTVTVTPLAGAPITSAPPAVAQTAPTPAVAAPALPNAVAPSVPAAIPAPNLVPATSGTLNDFLKGKNVALQPQRPEGFTALKINLPMPQGWARVPDPNVPDAFLVTADRVGGDGLYTSNAQLVVYRLIGDFDPKEAITHGFVDSQSQPTWQTTDASMGYFQGNPSSLIEGTFRQNDMMLNTSRRHVIVASGPDKYLVSLSVTTSVNQAVAAGGSTDAIVNGFQVSAATPAHPPAPPA